MKLTVVTFRVSCSKGTYIRTLCYDIGVKCGCLAAMKSLKRIKAGVFREESAITVEAHCRDIDQWEKRDGKWLIVKRVVAGDNTYIVRPEYLDDYNNSRGKKADPADQFFASLKD